tara:strand:- start:342 stop:839 length:498 start_codon:yes stop_codon:yes gene_type:complete
MIDYEKERKKFRPKSIKTLLIAEAPPPSGKFFFYVPRKLQLGRSIDQDTSLPSTIFNHYFNRRPSNNQEYIFFLNELKRKRIFLIDILDEPIKIRNNKENVKYLISRLPDLKKKIKDDNIELDESKWIFLLARNTYKKYINQLYPEAQKIRWKDFRLTSENQDYL